MKAFGVILIIVAAACGLGALSQTRETEMEKLNNRVISSAEDGLKTSQAMYDYIEASARLQGAELPPRDTRSRDSMLDSLSDAQVAAAKYRSERNQKMLLWLGGAAVSFLAGIICFSAGKRSAVGTATPTRTSTIADSTPVAGQNVEARLANLKSLLEKGLISQTEHDSKKGQVLDEL